MNNYTYPNGDKVMTGDLVRAIDHRLFIHRINEYSIITISDQDIYIKWERGGSFRCPIHYVIFEAFELVRRDSKKLFTWL